MSSTSVLTKNTIALSVERRESLMILKTLKGYRFPKKWSRSGTLHQIFTDEKH